MPYENPFTREGTGPIWLIMIAMLLIFLGIIINGLGV